MTSPMNISFLTTTADYDLFKNSIIRTQIEKHFGSSILESIDKGNAGMIVTVYVDTESKIKFLLEDNYQNFLVKKIYSSSGIIFPKHCYIKDTAISGTLSIQIQ